MSNYDNGFARAQASYENQMPPEYDDPEFGEYIIEGSVVDTPANRAKLESIYAWDVEIIGDNDVGENLISFTVESEDNTSLDDVIKEYNKVKLILQSMNASIEKDKFTERFDD